MLDIAAVLASTGQKAVVVPCPHPELVTRRVLVMERLDGFGWDDVEGMRRAGIDTNAVVGPCSSCSWREPPCLACSMATCTAATFSSGPTERWPCSTTG